MLLAPALLAFAQIPAHTYVCLFRATLLVRHMQKNMLTLSNMARSSRYNLPVRLPMPAPEFSRGCVRGE